MPSDLRHQVPRFVVAGGLASGTHAAIYLGLVTMGWVPPVPATVIGVSVGTVLSYALNSRYTFQRATSPGSFARFWVVTGVGAALNAGLVALGVAIGGHPAPVGLGAIVVAATCNFLGHRWWTFRE